MLELASLGAKVLQIRSVKFAHAYGVPIHVRSRFTDDEGTWVVREEEVMERLVVSGVTYNRNEAKIRVRGVKDQPGVAARALRAALGGRHRRRHDRAERLARTARTDMTFTVPRGDFKRALELAETAGARGRRERRRGRRDDREGLGRRARHEGPRRRRRRACSRCSRDEGINIQMISTSEIKISVVIEEKYTELAVRALHDAFVEHGAAAPQPE